MTYDTINDAVTISGNGGGSHSDEKGTPMDKSVGDGPTMRPKNERGGRGAFAPGDVIARRYVVEKVLGEGGMGIVYQCLDRVGGVSVAVKCLPPEVSRNADEMDDIRANYQLVRQLRHPNIAGATSLELDDSTGDYYLVMDLARGTSLKRWMRRNPQATAEAKLAILRQVAAALDYAHTQKVIHRDVKPENVMVDDEGGVKVLDFGLAAQIRSSQSRTSAAVTSRGGTPGYKSPEQWRGKPQREPADVYSFGVMAYWMFAGELPFDGDDPVVLGHAVLTEPVEPVAGLSAHMNAALAKALTKQPEARFASCGEVVDALEGKIEFSRVEHVERVEGENGRVRSPSGLGVGDGLGHKERKDRKGGVGRVLVVVALLAALAGGVLWWWQGDQTRAKRTRRARTTEMATPQVLEGSPVMVVSSGNSPKSAVSATTNETDAVTSSYMETHEEKARRAHELYMRREGRKILETFSDYDAEMVPEIAYLKGVVHRDGFSGVKKDLHKTAHYFTIAANRGHVQAQMDLATMYAEGIGVSRDLDKFLYWSEKVADQGVADAAFNMGYLYFSGGAGGRIKVDYTKALKYLKLAADAGRFSACPYLGTMYLKGWGVKADNMEALKWFKLGAENGDALSENNLGFMYLKGVGTPKDTAKALEYLQKADAHGNHGAAMSLGLMYENGDGVPQDLQEARRLYVRAKEHKVDGAEKALRRIDGKLGKESNSPQNKRQVPIPSAKPRAVGILTQPGDHSRSSKRAVDEVGKVFYEQSYELTHSLPIIRNRYTDKPGRLAAAGQFLALCREDEFSDLKVEEVEFYPTGEYLVVTMKNMQLVKIAWEGMHGAPTEESKKNLRVQLGLVREALRAYPKSTDIFVAVQPGVVDMVPRWGRRFKASRPLKPQTITIRPAK